MIKRIRNLKNRISNKLAQRKQKKLMDNIKRQLIRDGLTEEVMERILNCPSDIKRVLLPTLTREQQGKYLKWVSRRDERRYGQGN